MAEHPQPPQIPWDYEEETFTDAVVRTVKNKPAVMGGLGAMGAALGYGYWRWKNKGFLVSPSMFLMQLRVGAQGAVVGCLIIGMTYNLINNHLLKKKPEK